MSCETCGGRGQIEYDHGGHAGNVAPEMDLRSCPDCTETEFTPRKVRKLEAVVRSWRLAPGPESTLQGQAAEALGRYAAILESEVR